MAYSLFQVGEVWHYRFQIDGKRIQRTTRETVKERADTIARRAHDRARIYARGDEPVPTLEELVAKWLQVHEKTRSEDHRRSVETFGRLHLYGLEKRLISWISTEAIELARAKHLEAHAPASANHWLRIMKLLFNWAKSREMIPEIRWRVRMLKVQKKPRQILPISKAKEWLEAVDEAAREREGIKIAIRLMLGLGLREEEALGSRWEWFDWERRTYTPGETKGREAEPIPVPAWLLEYLGRFPAARRHAFPRGFLVFTPAGDPYRPGVARRVMAKANAKTGIVGLTPHRLRGTFATLLSESGVAIQEIQAVMRHKDPKTTLGYLEKDLSRAAQAADEIAERMGLKTRRENGERGSSKGHKN